MDPEDVEGQRFKELCLVASKLGMGRGLPPACVGDDEVEFNKEDVKDDVEDLVEMEVGGVLRTKGCIGNEGVGVGVVGYKGK